MSTKPPLISIVEDDELVRLSLRRLIRSAGYAVEVFSSGVDFLAFPRLGETSCLITDINMPQMTGPELLRRLIDTGRRIPTIFITAYLDLAVRDRALKDGALCYLTKPFDDDQLLDCVRMAVDPTSPSP